MKLHRKLVARVALGAMLSAQLSTPLAYAQSNDNNTTTPIKHIIVLIGENRTFDHTFATYQPSKGQTIKNLLSEGIINADGSPGPNASVATQFKVPTLPSLTYSISFSSASKIEYSPSLPTPEANGAPFRAVTLGELESNPTGVQPPFDSSVSQTQLALLEPSFESSDLGLLRTGATGLADTIGLDSRVTNATTLLNTVFQLTGPSLPYDSYTGDTVHRLFHMWQQSDCNVSNATLTNPSGCLNDLYPYVATARDDSGSNSMGFYNMQNGDVPLFAELANTYTISDNFHQSIMGGTAANHMALGTGDAIFRTTAPPPGTIANPNPTSATSDTYVKDKAWTKCSDTTQPGIKAIVDYLASLTLSPIPYNPSPNCAPGNYYMINNLSPGFNPDGTIDTTAVLAGTKVPPSSLRTIGDELNDNSISWKYYGGGWNAAVRVAKGSMNPFDQAIANNYCDICNFESYAASIMGSFVQRTAHIKDATDFFNDLNNGTLPAVSFVKPDGFADGHPASSKFDLFEAMLRKTVDGLKANPQLFKETALFVAFDEGGGYWDSGYMQPLDFFGDGPRIPFIVVSFYSRGGKVVHTYYDHVSILKFIERNWSFGSVVLNPLTTRSRDRLPNPTSSADPYVPGNPPAIGDLMDMFNFGNHV